MNANDKNRIKFRHNRHAALNDQRLFSLWAKGDLHLDDARRMMADNNRLMEITREQFIHNARHLGYV